MPALRVPPGLGAITLALLALAVLVLLPMGLASAQEEVRQRLDQQRAALVEVEKAVGRDGISDGELQQLRGRVDPVVEQLREIIAGETPRLEGVKARLEQLGPKPDAEKGQTESADVTRERAEQEKLLRDIEDDLRRARLLSVQADQIKATIGDRRRELLARALMERSRSVLSPLLWLDVAKALPLELTALQFMLRDWWRDVLLRLDTTTSAILGAAAIVMLILIIPARRAALRFAGRNPEVQDVPRLTRALAACRVTFLWACVPLAVGAGLHALLDLLGLLPYRIEPTVRTVLYGGAVIAFANGLAIGLLSPAAPAWRLFNVDDNTARRLTRLATVFTTVLVVGKTVEALNQSIVAALPVTVATKGLFATLAALVVLFTLRQLRVVDDAAPASPAATTALTAASQTAASLAAAPAGLPLRLAAWLAVLLVLGSAVLGYVALASFLTEQMTWIVGVGAMLTLVLILVDEVVGRGLSPDGLFGRQISLQVGVRRNSLQQVSILASGLLRVIVIVLATMLVLAPWGLDGGDFVGTLRAALFGFSVGGVTISLSTILVALALFMVGFMATRSIQRWLDKSYLPHTSLDPGLRHSISTILGYIGIVIAAMIALSQLGFSLDKLTIVAGALSVGIGFGLQSIVNNFVSGLILLWERPIRVGDWIVVGEEQGIVKRINVRSTQIETFDRASLIVPNAEFISGRVKNWMYSDRIGRIIIPISVAYNADPELVRKLLMDIALGHREVMSEPKPRVFFMKLGTTTLDFELRIFADVDAMLPIKSDVLFQIVERFREAGISLQAPAPPPVDLLMQSAALAPPTPLRRAEAAPAG
jgi:small-conductance mechanosensitive channel